MEMNYGLAILLDNASSYAERNTLFSLTESDLNKVNNTMIANLYKSAIQKSHVDFDEIPNSKGDITKYTGYNTMVNVLNTIKEISLKTNIKVPEIMVVEQAIGNITTFKDTFEKGFKLEKDFIILQYNTLVLACVDSVSMILSSYVDYLKRPDRIEFSLIKDTKRSGWLSLNNLERFNKTVKSGEFTKVSNAIIATGSQGFVGIDDVAVGAIIVGGVLMLIPIMRELIFYFYYTRMKASDYLKHQADFLELNKTSVESSNLSADRKKSILKKQEEKIATLRKWSEKIRVNHTISESKANDELAKQNKSWTINDVHHTESKPNTQSAFSLI